MSALVEHLEFYGIDPIEAMNLLQEHGIVSDECVNAEDVADSDIPRAVEFLEQNEI